MKTMQTDFGGHRGGHGTIGGHNDATSQPGGHHMKKTKVHNGAIKC